MHGIRVTTRELASATEAASPIVPITAPLAAGAAASASAACGGTNADADARGSADGIDGVGESVTIEFDSINNQEVLAGVVRFKEYAPRVFAALRRAHARDTRAS